MKCTPEQESDVAHRGQHFEGAHRQDTRLGGAEMDVQAALVRTVGAVLRHGDLTDVELCKWSRLRSGVEDRQSDLAIDIV